MAARKTSNTYENNFPYIHELIDGVWHRKSKKKLKGDWERLVITHEDISVCIGNGKNQKIWDHRTKAVWNWVPTSKLEK